MNQEMQFPDGQLPSKEIIKKWLSLVDDFFSEQYNGGQSAANVPVSVETKAGAPDQASEKVSSGKKKSGDQAKADERRIGVHCLAGLGRAPFLVAIALVNNGCSPSNAIDLIRKNRPGAFNLT